MLLAVDIGNTNVVLGIAQGKEWLSQLRLETSLQKDAPAYATEISTLFLENDQKLSSIDQIVLSSVVPPLAPVLHRALHELFQVEALVVGPEIYEKLPMSIDRPHEIGADLVANVVAAYNRFKQSCIIVDFGTALTLTAVSDQGEILGVAIAPGLKTSIFALFHNTAQLPEVPLELPESVIGKNTVHSLQAGVLWGYVGLVEFMIKKMKGEMRKDCKVIATGGLSKIIHPLREQFDDIDQLLTLDGLRIINEKYRD